MIVRDVVTLVSNETSPSQVFHFLFSKFQTIKKIFIMKPIHGLVVVLTMVIWTGVKGQIISPYQVRDT